MNLESKNIDTVISNLETLVTEMKAWRDANLEFSVIEENPGKSQSLIFYTHEKKVADRVFKSACFVTTAEDFLKNTLNDSNENNALVNERSKMNETLDLIFKTITSPSFEEDRLLADPGKDLSDTLLSDLEEIGLSTIEREATKEDEVEPLPDDLFDDLNDEDDLKGK